MPGRKSTCVRKGADVVVALPDCRRVIGDLRRRVDVFYRALKAVAILGPLAAPDDGENALLQRLERDSLRPRRRVHIPALLLLIQPLYGQDIAPDRVVLQPELLLVK